MSSAQTEVRSALASYIEGVTPLPVFEQSVARLLAGRMSARGIVHSELKAAVADGTLPPESLRRLGLVDSPVVPVAEHPDSDPKERDNRRARNAARNRDVAANDAQAARASLKARGRKPASASLDSADTGSQWIDNRRSTPQIPQCGALLGNRYRLERVIGEGGMGVVFLAVDQEVRGEMFAVKVLRPEIRDNAESLRLLREEVRRTRALRHPHIVGVYSLNSDPSGVYMLMEYLEGKSLKTVLDEEFGRGMPVIKAWPMIYDVGSALAYAHDHNVVHSDIKPSNVIITSSGSCKLLDFGIARADRNRTTTRDATAIGALTPAYACCEMFEGRAPDQSDDVYAFACVIYEMLTGRHPFGRMNAVDARAQKLQPAPIKVLTNRQNHALARALEFQRERRTASVEILLEGLKGMVNNRRDRTAWYTSGAAIAAVVAVSTGWFLEHRASHRDSASAVAPAAALEPAQSPAAAPEPSPASLQTPPKGEHGQGTPPALGAAGSSTSKGKASIAAISTPAAGASTPATKPVAIPPILPVFPVSPASVASVAPLLPISPVPPVTSPNKATPPLLITAPPPVASRAPLSEPYKANPAPLIATAPSTSGISPLPEPDKAALAPVVPAEPKVTGSGPLLEPSTTLTKAAATAAIPKASKPTEENPPAPATPNMSVTTEAIVSAPKAKIPVVVPERALAPTAVGGGPTAVLTPLPAATAATTSVIATSATSAPAGGVSRGEIDHPPFGKKLPAVVATLDSQTKMQSDEKCAYPAEARNELQTGTVVLLVYVLPDGSAAKAELDGDGSSGSPALDQAALKCVRELGHFPAKLVSGKPMGYWARTKFVWSFGG